jgi:hypothetical protein
MKSWHGVESPLFLPGRTLCRFCPSVNRHGGTWRIISLLMFNLSAIILRAHWWSRHHFIDFWDCVCISRGCRTPAFWIILKILTPVFKSFHPYTLLWLMASSPQRVCNISCFYWRFTQLKMQLTHWAATLELPVTGFSDPYQLLVRGRTALRCQ